MARHFGALGLPQGQARAPLGRSGQCVVEGLDVGQRRPPQGAATWCNFSRQVAPGSGAAPTRGGRSDGGGATETFRGLIRAGRGLGRTERYACPVGRALP